MAAKAKISVSFLIALCFSLTAAAIDPSQVTELVPLGNTTGIKLFCDGVMVVDTAHVDGANGTENPAQKAGIVQGDVIKKLAGKSVHSNEELQDIVADSRGKAVDVEIMRNGERVKTRITPVVDSQGEYKIGLWIRDSMAGIGTMTFYDPKHKIFGALGHGICDTDTNALVPFGSGTLMEAKVTEVKKGKSGEPGELVGEYDLSRDSGILSGNTPGGIFGKFADETPQYKCIPIGRSGEVHTGTAEILANVSGDRVESYTVEITRIFSGRDDELKNMMLRVTDERLLKKTGGIVQGMSGSPIIQDGKLVGAVTHVLVNDPTRGYGIFIENMLSELEKIK